MISRETVRLLVGLLLAIPLAFGPVVVVGLFLFWLRNASARTIRTINLICASCAVLLLLMAISGARWAGSAPRAHGVTAHQFVTGRAVIFTLIVVFWFAGAVGMIFRNRLAWIGSLLGAGASAGFFAACCASMVAFALFSTSASPSSRNFGVASDMVSTLIALTPFSCLFAFSLRLAIGLLQRRKDLCGDQAKAPAKGPSPDGGLALPSEAEPARPPRRAP